MVWVVATTLPSASATVTCVVQPGSRPKLPETAAPAGRIPACRRAGPDFGAAPDTPGSHRRVRARAMSRRR